MRNGSGESRLANGRNFDKVRLNKEGYEKVHTIHYNWYLHSLKAIMGQMGKEVLPKLDYSKHHLLCYSTFVAFRKLFQSCFSEFLGLSKKITQGRRF